MPNLDIKRMLKPGYPLDFTRLCTLGPVLERIEVAGGSIERLCKRIGLAPYLFEEPKAVILLADQIAFLDGAIGEIGDVALPARLSMAAGIQGLGTYGEIVAGQETLGDALKVGQAMLPISLQTGSVVGLRIDGRWAHWEYKLAEGFRGERAASNEILATGYTLSVFRHYCGAVWSPPRLTSPIGASHDASVFEALFGCDIAAGHRVILTFPADLLDCPNLSPIKIGDIDHLPDSSDLEVALRQVIISSFGEERPNIRATAARLGISQRTLQRRLHESGTSFETVLRDTTMDIAMRLMLKETSMTETALHLGFSDPTQFSRAFRRWMGTSPSSWRKSNRQGCSHHSDNLPVSVSQLA